MAGQVLVVGAAIHVFHIDALDLLIRFGAFILYYAFIAAIGIIGPFALCVGAAYVDKGLVRLAGKADAVKNPIVRKVAGYVVAGLSAALVLDPPGANRHRPLQASAATASAPRPCG
jgi:hypothetical protein